MLPRSLTRAPARHFLSIFRSRRKCEDPLTRCRVYAIPELARRRWRRQPYRHRPGVVLPLALALASALDHDRRDTSGCAQGESLAQSKQNEVVLRKAPWRRRQAPTVVEVVPVPGLLVVPVLGAPEGAEGQDLRYVHEVHPSARPAFVVATARGAQPPGRRATGACWSKSMLAVRRHAGLRLSGRGSSRAHITVGAR
jgi:hypothetical protein